MGMFDRLRGWFPSQTKDNGVRVNWPAAPYLGSGDMGPPGEWQLRSRQVSDETLMSFSAVYASISIISGDVGKLPIVFQDIDKDGVTKVNRTYPLNRLMRRPNRYQNRMQFITSCVISYLTTGNAYVYGRRNGSDMITEMHVLDPRSAWPYVSDSGEIYYRVGQGNNTLAGIRETVNIPARDICHLRMQFSATYPLLGVSPIFAAAASSAMGQRILYNAQQFFANGAQPGGMLTAPGKISEDLAKRLQQDFDQNFSGRRTGKTAVLGEGLEFKPMMMNATDAQLIEQLRWSVEDVARVFRMPPFMIGDQSKVTYRNSEQLARTYLSGCLDFHLSMIVDAFNQFFELSDGTMTMAFDLAYLLRTESDVRYEANGKAINGGWKTVNEVRRDEGMEPMANGDTLLVQGAMRSLDVIVNAPAASTGGAGGSNPESMDTPQLNNDSNTPKPETQGAADKTYQGVWSKRRYQAGQSVTHDGALWVALRDTALKPGEFTEALAWQLAVKSGVNGKTPTMRVNVKAGTLEASYDGGTNWQSIGNITGLFKDAVAEALKELK